MKKYLFLNLVLFLLMDTLNFPYPPSFNLPITKFSPPSPNEAIAITEEIPIIIPNLQKHYLNFQLVHLPKLNLDY